VRIYWYAPFDNANELALAERIARPGDDVVVQSLATRFGERLSARADGFRLVRDLPEPAGDGGDTRSLGSRAAVALTAAERRERYLSSERFDLLHLHTLNTFVDGVAVPALRRKKVPIVQSVHNVREHQRRLPPRIETIMLRPIYRAADAVIVAHPLLGGRLIDEFGVSAEQVHVVPLAIPEVPVVAELEPSAEPLCLFFGTFRRNKGIALLLEAIRLIDRSTALKFHFAGRGELELERLVVEAAEEDSRISCEIGYVMPTRAAELYRAASLVLMPYTWFAAQSGVLREAYAYATPVVATCVGPLGDAVKNEGTGWVCAPDDPVELARTLCEAAADDGRRVEMQRRMRRLSAERTPDVIAASIRAIYDSVTSEEVNHGPFLQPGSRAGGSAP
jgi:glycosyltransferase involved in cell wall biosynthesis